jgi:hypothetical protein
MKDGSWSPYDVASAQTLASILLVAVIALAYGAIRLRRPIGVQRPGRFVASALVLTFFLSGFSFLSAVFTYGLALYAQGRDYTEPPNPITPITAVSGLVSFVVILILTRKHGIWNALLSAAVGTIAAPMIFELPFDLIVAGRTFPPDPATLYTPLFFLPLFAVGITSFAMLAFSPALKLSRYTLFCLAGMFLVFAVWAINGFGYPLTTVPFVLNAASKILAFITTITLFLPTSLLSGDGPLARHTSAHDQRAIAA